MNPEEFKNQYMGSFEVSEKEKELFEIAKYYHETCEAYDQIHCSVRAKDGTAMPVGHEELGNINRQLIK